MIKADRKIRLVKLFRMLQVDSANSAELREMRDKLAAYIGQDVGLFIVDKSAHDADIMPSIKEAKLPSWRTDKPPKDKPFLADCNWPFVVVAAWNETEDDYVFANYAVDQVQLGPSHPVTEDTWFENEHTDKVKRWMPLPEVGND